MRNSSALALGLLLATPVCAAAPGGGVFAYVKDGQSQEQQSKDQFECNQWAVQQTGYDPAAPAPQPVLSQPAPPCGDSASNESRPRGSTSGSSNSNNSNNSNNSSPPNARRERTITGAHTVPA
jgi:hypothetical protein